MWPLVSLLNHCNVRLLIDIVVITCLLVLCKKNNPLDGHPFKYWLVLMLFNFKEPSLNHVSIELLVLKLVSFWESNTGLLSLSLYIMGVYVCLYIWSVFLDQTTVYLIHMVMVALLRAKRAILWVQQAGPLQDLAGWGVP